MSSSDFYQPVDADILRLENELLSYEVTFLRARLSEQGRPTPASASARMAYSELEEYARGLREKLQTVEQYALGLKEKLEAVQTYASGLRDEVVELRKAQSDLRRLLTGLNRTPVGPVLRVSKRYREIASRNKQPATTDS